MSLALITHCTTRHESVPTHSPAISADEALCRLVDGNQRFLAGQTRWERIRIATIATLASGQQPYATVLGCSDARVPPELIFDASFGELFVVRVAGNVLSGEAAGTLQYAEAHLGTPLFVVLGHSSCGALEAALEARRGGHPEDSGIRLLVESVLPALDGIDASLPTDAQMVLAIEHNVRWTLRQIAATPRGRVRLADGRLKLVGAIYDMASGRVHWLDETVSSA